MKTNIIKDASKADYDFVLQDFIMALGKQLTKLPHEIWDEPSNKASNTTHKDIVISYADMTDHLESMLICYCGKDDVVRPSNDKKEEEIFTYAKEKFGRLIQIAHDKGLLLEKIKAKAEMTEDFEYASTEEPSPTPKIPNEQPG